MYFRHSLIILICACLVSTPCFAEFYRYTDENGVTRFTDNLADVPEKQKVRAYAESVSPDKGAEQDQEEDAAQPKKSSKKTQDILHEEYAELVKERKALDEESGKKDKYTPRELKAFDNKVKEYNERIAAYEKKRAALEEKKAEMEEMLKKTVKEAGKESEKEPENEE